MFVIVSLFSVRIGEADAVIALHEAWQRHQQSKAQGYISGELLRTIQGSGEFITIMRFESRECAQACVNSPEFPSRYRCLVSRWENLPEPTE